MPTFNVLTLLEIMRVHAWRSWFGSQYDARVGWIVWRDMNVQTYRQQSSQRRLDCC
jgi:hypothetical protein